MELVIVTVERVERTVPPVISHVPPEACIVMLEFVDWIVPAAMRKVVEPTRVTAPPRTVPPLKVIEPAVAWMFTVLTVVVLPRTPVMVRLPWCAKTIVPFTVDMPRMLIAAPAVNEFDQLMKPPDRVTMSWRFWGAMMPVPVLNG